LAGGRAVGQFEAGTATFPVRRSKHYFRYVGGYTLDAELVRRLPASCEWVIFDDRELGRRFRVGLMDFLAASVPVQFGFGEKLCAPETIYEVLEAPQMTLFPLPAPVAPQQEARPDHG
jgi:hypothetical protein